MNSLPNETSSQTSVQNCAHSSSLGVQLSVLSAYHCSCQLAQALIQLWTTNDAAHIPRPLHPSIFAGHRTTRTQ